MDNSHKFNPLSNTQLIDYIFNDLGPKKTEQFEAYLLDNEIDFANTLELIVLTLEKGLSKRQLLGLLNNTSIIDFYNM